MSQETEDNKYNWSGVIETYTGKAFDVYMPTVEMVRFDDIVHPLSLICRYNGHIPEFYSVAEHSVRVMWYLRDRDATPQEQLAGLMHDAAEAYVGDMIRPLKRHGEMGFHHAELELGVMQVIADRYGVQFPFPQSVHDADKEMYFWEVLNIRSGKEFGWSPQQAREAFTLCFDGIMKEIYK